MSTTTETATKPLADQGPVEIDTALHTLYARSLGATLALALAADALHAEAGDRKNYGRGSQASWGMAFDVVQEEVCRVVEGQQPDAPAYLVAQAHRCYQAYQDATEALRQIGKDTQVLDAEFRARGGWTRAFLVTNGDGHVHSPMGCSTCNHGATATSFQWMVDYADHDEAEIIAAAGWRACTTCYPAAPVGDAGTLPTRMFSEEDIARQRAREERAEAAAKRLADKVAKGLTEDGSEFAVTYCERNSPGWDWGTAGERVHVYRDRDRTERFKTERAALQWVVETLTDAQSAPGGSWAQNRAQDREPATRAIMVAVATKHGHALGAVHVMVAGKAAAKVKRDARR